MSVEDAIELGQRSIYHATFRDAVSGGTVSGELSKIAYLIKSCFLSAAVYSDSQSSQCNCSQVGPSCKSFVHMQMLCDAVYHVTEKGWTKVRGEDVGELHYKYYKTPEDHPCNGNLQL